MLLKAKCPICRKPTLQGEEYFPFCSERCQLIDLGNWSSEEYRIPGERVDRMPTQAGDEGDDDSRRS